MKYFTWQKYYEKFCDWVESTQIRSLSYLQTLGEADEVAEIIIELQVNILGSRNRCSGHGNHH